MVGCSYDHFPFFLGAYKLARHVLEKIQGLVVPKRFKENVDLATLMIRAKPYYDNEELLVCFIYNPFIYSS